MRKMLVLLGALMLAAAPATAQQSGPAAPSDGASRAAVVNTAAPSLFPTTDQVKAEVRAREDARAQSGAAMTERDFLYLVAAIVIGVVIAAVILD